MDNQNLPPMKKPRVEPSANGENGEVDESNSVEEQEEALVALIEHRTKEVDHLKRRVSYYKSQLEDAEKRLADSQTKLVRIRKQNSAPESVPAPVSIGHVKEERPSPSPVPPPIQSQSKPPLIIPAVNPKIIAQELNYQVPRAAKMDETRVKEKPGPSSRASSPVQSENAGRLKRAIFSQPSPEKEVPDLHEKVMKRKSVAGHKEHKDLIPSIGSRSSPTLINFQEAVYISSQHKRKLRSLILNPANGQLFVTSALDGVVNLWQVLARGSSISLLSTTDCLSPKQRRWPEDITWHPDGHSLFAAYSADGGDCQISVLNLNSSRENRVTFLQERPHSKGVINSIEFMPWDDDLGFATGGNDHGVILWHEGSSENSWKPKVVHKNLHSSAVTGVAGLQQKKIILSSGADKRIVGYDLVARRSEFKHQLESKCTSVLPNPSDLNLYMVQTTSPERQLRLFDIRLRQTEIHAFGWKQESSETQSALINQAWSPDGLYLTSGSADPMFHIFDIRYKNRKPAQSVQAHQKRVFRAVWHQSLPLLISISSDLNIGLHRRL